MQVGWGPWRAGLWGVWALYGRHDRWQPLWAVHVSIVCERCVYVVVKRLRLLTVECAWGNESQGWNNIMAALAQTKHRPTLESGRHACMLVQHMYRCGAFSSQSRQARASFRSSELCERLA